MVKVLHVVNISFVIPYYLGEQLNYFDARGYKFYIACSPDSFFSTLPEKYSFTPLELEVKRAISPVADLKSIRALAKYIKDNGITKVIGHTPKGGMVAMVAARLAGVKDRTYIRHGLVFETATGWKRALLTKVEKFTAGLASRVVNVSRSVAEKSTAAGLNPAEKNILLGAGTFNGIDVSRFAPVAGDDIAVASLKAKYGITAQDTVVGFVGRLVKDKGVTELIGAWKIIKADGANPGLKLLLVGPFEERDSVDEDTRRYIESEGSIVHTGLIHDITPFYSLMDMFILPSYREGFPTVVLEASAMELPVITTTSTGCVDAIIEGKTGIFTGLEPEAMAGKILEMANDSALRERLGRNGRKWVADNFRQEILWQEIEDKILSR